MNFNKLRRRMIKIFSRFRIAIGVMCVVIIVIFFIGTYFSTAPLSFTRGTIVHISKDTTVTGTANMLKKEGLIRSAFVYKVYVVLLHNGRGVQEGSYLFVEPQSALRIAYRTAYGISDIQKLKLTVFEGTNVKEIANQIKKLIPTFDSKSFIAQAQKYEGYLFPETYFLDQNVEPNYIIEIMRKQFDIAIKSLNVDIASSTRSVKDIITMASIIEKEASNHEDRKIISGILWKRLEKGMLLQVDVPFYYIMNVNSAGLSLKDLATSSPYNTYIHRGLPPTPITNPGLDAIMAALYPTSSNYFFYLADKNGVTHYATTHDGHLANKERYLR